MIALKRKAKFQRGKAFNRNNFPLNPPPGFATTSGALESLTLN